MFDIWDEAAEHNRAEKRGRIRQKYSAGKEKKISRLFQLFFSFQRYDTVVHAVLFLEASPRQVNSQKRGEVLRCYYSFRSRQSLAQLVQNYAYEYTESTVKLTSLQRFLGRLRRLTPEYLPRHIPPITCLSLPAGVA